MALDVFPAVTGQVALAGRVPPSIRLLCPGLRASPRCFQALPVPVYGSQQALLEGSCGGGCGTCSPEQAPAIGCILAGVAPAILGFSLTCFLYLRSLLFSM